MAALASAVSASAAEPALEVWGGARVADAESGPRIATPEEVEAALTGLIKADRARLMSYARWRIDGLGRAALGRKAKDLFGEAVTATLAGNRRWQPDSV